MRNIQLVKENLIQYLTDNMRQASSIYILTSFVMKSGVKLIEPHLKEAAERGADIYICSGDYLYITQPEALEILMSIHPKVNVRLWKSAGRSFHPKAYMFEYEKDGVFIVGSSNLSRSALTYGVEWNILVEEESERETFDEIIKSFYEVYINENTVPLNKETIHMYKKDYEFFHQKHKDLAKTWSKQEEIDIMLPTNKDVGNNELITETTTPYHVTIQPRFAQVEALEELERTVEEGYEKAMVVMATGLGKTYLAAFFAQKYKKILFLAHLEEILYQAEKSFQQVIQEKTTGIYNGKEKESNVDIVFASIQTLMRRRNLEMFDSQEFDLIIVDEFHHAAADSYQSILQYFQPAFLLGVTATPDRNDFRDIYSICDGNVAYRISFIEAIQQTWLAPFHYFGVHDQIDYSQIRWLGNKYDAEELAMAQLKEDVAANIVQAWEKHKQTRSLVFCSSILQAEYLSNHFNERGYKTVSLHSQTVGISREQAILRLKNGEIDAIMTVNLFNEGVDIPQVDTLLFARPTESLTVFTQQIGRGLRLAEGKKHCVIIDLIANYRNADIKQSLLYLDADGDKKKRSEKVAPAGCVIEYEVEAKQLLDELAKKRMPRKNQLRESYLQVKRDLGRRPTYLELHKLGIEDARGYRQEFSSYCHFLHWADELSALEEEVLFEHADWLQEVEKTTMTKSYKMIVLQGMLLRGKNRAFDEITPNEIAQFFHHFFMEKTYRKRIDFSDKQSKKLWDYDEGKVADLIAKMPMTKWSGASNGLISFENNIFQLSFSVKEEYREILYQWTKEICDYRLHVHFERRAGK